MKKIGLLLLIMALGVWGCVTVDNSTMVDADQSGAASGQYRDVRHGKLTDFSIFGGGGAASATGSAALMTANLASLSQSSNGPSSGGGGGLFGLHMRPAPAQGDPLPFARSIAMINYAKKLKRVSYDDCGLVSFEFADQEPSRPSAFGHQPIK